MTASGDKSAVRLPLEIPAVALVISLVYYAVRAALIGRPLIYYDDGETLYHTLSLLSGRVPYRDDANHHFAGYLVPYLLGAKVFGFSIHLVTVVQFISQVLTGLGLYCCARFFCGRGPALVTAALVVTAREPWVLGSQPFYQTNVLMVWVWFLSIRCAMGKRAGGRIESALAGALCGLALISDQRTALFGMVPVAAIVWRGRSEIRDLIPLFASFAGAALIPPACSVAFLLANGAWADFIEQTFEFPATYRSGSTSILESLKQGMLVHHFLPTESPVLFLLGLAGLAFAARASRDVRARILLTAVLSVVPIGFLGGRDFDYYTIPHLALLGLLAAFAFGSFTPRTRGRVAVVAACSLVLPFVASIRLLNDFKVSPVVDDGVEQVVETLRASMKPAETVLVWGYRLEIYARLGKLAPMRTASNILFHPDPGVHGKEARLRHIFPKYQEEFLDWLKVAPPSWVVVFTQEPPGQLYSPASEALLNLVNGPDYELTSTFSGINFVGSTVRFEVYHRLEETKPSPALRGGE